MNGEALTKRYEVRDLDTGELLSGENVIVLRPEHDKAALSAIYVYGKGCGLEGDDLQLLAKYGTLHAGVRMALPPKAKPYEGIENLCVPLNALASPEGTLKRMEKSVQEMGYEMLSLVIGTRRIPVEEPE